MCVCIVVKMFTEINRNNVRSHTLWARAFDLSADVWVPPQKRLLLFRPNELGGERVCVPGFVVLRMSESSAPANYMTGPLVSACVCVCACEFRCLCPRVVRVQHRSSAENQRAKLPTASAHTAHTDTHTHTQHSRLLHYLMGIFICYVCTHTQPAHKLTCFDVIHNCRRHGRRGGGCRRADGRVRNVCAFSACGWIVGGWVSFRTRCGGKFSMETYVGGELVFFFWLKITVIYERIYEFNVGLKMNALLNVHNIMKVIRIGRGACVFIHHSNSNVYNNGRVPFDYTCCVTSFKPMLHCSVYTQPLYI